MTGGMRGFVHGDWKVIFPFEKQSSAR